MPLLSRGACASDGIFCRVHAIRPLLSVRTLRGSGARTAIADAASCTAGRASGAGIAMGSGTNPSSKAEASAPTGVPAESDGEFRVHN